ncbi:hypothetical protein V8C86DRAFT_2520198 [Haematococcus lacustris]
MAEKTKATEVAKLDTWKIMIDKEQRFAREHDAAWSFLHHPASTPVESNKRDYHVTPTKYYKNGATLLHKRIPKLPSEQLQMESSASVTADDLLASGRFKDPPRPMTAMDSTIFSHAKSLAEIRDAPPCYSQTSSTYGSRHPLEQFGVCQHAVQATAVTRWERSEFYQK